MSSILRYAAAGVALASLGIASGAQAATTADAQATAEILTPLAVAVVAGDDTLNFGTIAPGASSANVVVAPDGTLTCPAVVLCSNLANVNAPAFDVEGAAGQLVNVTFANATETLTSGANTMSVGSFTTGLAGDQVTLDAGTGLAQFTVGGTLTVPAGQPAGTYSGQLTVNVAYN